MGAGTVFPQVSRWARGAATANHLCLKQLFCRAAKAHFLESKLIPPHTFGRPKWIANAFGTYSREHGANHLCLKREKPRVTALGFMNWGGSVFKVGTIFISFYFIQFYQGDCECNKIVSRTCTAGPCQLEITLFCWWHFHRCRPSLRLFSCQVMYAI